MSASSPGVLSPDQRSPAAAGAATAHREGGQRPRGRVVYAAYTDAAGYPPLHHSALMLANEGWEVLVLGVRVPVVNSLRFPEHDRILLRCLPAAPSGWRQKVHYVYFCLWVAAWTRRFGARWVYASDPLSCPAALITTFLPRVSVLYHEHDSPSVEEASRSFFSRAVMATRRWLSRRAKICVLPQADRADWFRRTLDTASEVSCVWNCPARAEAAPPPHPSADGRIRVVYQGSVVPDRLPLSLAQALKRLPERVTLDVIGYATQGRPNYVAEFEQLCRDLGVAHRVHFHGPSPRAELLDLCRGCDIGLALIRDGSGDINMRLMVGASNKPFDYLACGLPLLVADAPSWRETYVEPGYALACDPESAESIADALRWYLDHPVERREMGEAGRRRILTEWNYEFQFRAVLERINRLSSA